MGRPEKIPHKLYDFINYDDTVVKHNRRHYKAFCKKCGADRGYKRPNKFDAVCGKCQTEIMRAAITVDSRKKQSNSMLNKIPWNKRRSKEQVKLRHSISSLVNKRLKKRGACKYGESFFNKIGYSFDDLVEHLESLFQADMTWDNYGQWHIDHRIPDSLFQYNSMNDMGFKNSWALENLQPLWAEENLKKSDKVV